MWIKIAGACLLLLSGGLWAEGRTRAERRALARVEAFGELFAHVGERIEGLCLPLDEILASLPPPLLAACGCGEAPPTLAALRAAMERTEGEAGELLRRSAARLGQGTREDPVRLCRATAQGLQACRERMAPALARDARARRTLALCAGLGAVIWLW